MNNLNSKEERDEQKGFMFLYKGIVGIRNRKAHDNVILDDRQRAIEYLYLASLLIRLLEEGRYILDELWDKGLSLYKDNKYTESINAFEELIKVNPYSNRAKEAQKMIGINYSKLGDHHNAEAALEKAIKMGNNLSSTFFSTFISLIT